MAAPPALPTNHLDSPADIIYAAYVNDLASAVNHNGAAYWPTGVTGGLVTMTDATIGAGSTALHSASGKLAGAAIGDTVIVNGAGVGGHALVTTITALVDGTQVTLAAAATGAVAGVFALRGFDWHIPIEAAIAAGRKCIWLPAGTLWIPTGNAVAADVSVIGEDWFSCVIASNAPDTALLTFGRGTLMQNVAVWDSFGTNLTSANLPGGYNQPRPVRFFHNATDGASGSSHWYMQFALLLSASPGSATDRPAVGITASGLGDGLFAASYDGAAAIRVWNNEPDPANGGRGLLVQHYGQGDAIRLEGWPGAGGHLIALEPQADLQSVHMQPTHDTADDVVLVYTLKTNGNCLNIYHATSVFIGDVIRANLGNGGGGFGGNYLHFQLAGADVCRVDRWGALFASMSSKAGLPVAGDIPAGQWGVWKDTAGGGVYVACNDGGAIKKVQLV